LFVAIIILDKFVAIIILDNGFILFYSILYLISKCVRANTWDSAWIFTLSSSILYIIIVT